MIKYWVGMGENMPELLDQNGERVPVPEEPQRIISFSPAVTEILFELGLGDRIVGISAFCSRPPETKNIRKVGSYGSARIDLLKDLKPDLVLTISGFQSNFAKELSKHFHVYTLELPSSVAGIVDLVSRVGIVTGKITESKYMEFELMKYIGSLRRRPRLSGYVEIDLGGPTSFGAMSYITDALSLLGIESIYGRHYSEWVQPDPEFVRASDPDVVFYEPKMYSRFVQDDLKNLVDNRGWGELSAVRRNSVFVTPGNLDFFAHHGPSFIREVLPWVMEKVETL